MSGPTRRAVLGGLGAAVTIGWASKSARATISAERVRPGAKLTLRCPDADGFALTFGGGAPRRVDAPTGQVVIGAPRVFTDDDWTAITVVPTRGGRPVAAAAEVAVYTRAPSFGG